MDVFIQSTYFLQKTWIRYFVLISPRGTEAYASSRTLWARSTSVSRVVRIILTATTLFPNLPSRMSANPHLATISFSTVHLVHGPPANQITFRDVSPTSFLKAWKACNLVSSGHPFCFSALKLERRTGGGVSHCGEICASGLFGLLCHLCW